MSNPWLQKNPFMSIWLSTANSVAHSARAQVAATSRRQANAAVANAGQQVIDFWFGALTPQKPPSRARRTTKR